MLSRIALAAMFASVGFSQIPDRSFYLTNMTSAPQLNAITTVLRTVMDVQDLTVDESRHALVARATVDKMVGAEWLIHQLDQPAGSQGAGVSPDYRMAGEKGETVRIFRMAAGTTNANLTAMVTAIRTVADVQRLFPFESQQAIIGRAPLEEMETADWMVRQLAPADGKMLTGNSPVYPWKGYQRPDSEEEAVRIFRMSPDTTNASLTAMVTAIRTVADVQRLFPMEYGKAIVARATAGRLALAEWMVHELDQPSHAIPFVETRFSPPDRDDPTQSVVRVFYVAGTNDQVAKLIVNIRTTANVARSFPYISSGQSAIVLRGRADQMATVESMVAKFSKRAE